MNYMKGPYVTGVMNGLRIVLVEMAKLQESECRAAWNSSIIKNAAVTCKDQDLQKCTLDVDQVSSAVLLIRFTVASSSLSSCYRRFVLIPPLNTYAHQSIFGHSARSMSHLTTYYRRFFLFSFYVTD